MLEIRSYLGHPRWEREPAPGRGQTWCRDGRSDSIAEFPSGSHQPPIIILLRGELSLWLRGAQIFPKAMVFFGFFLTKKILISQYVVEIRTLGPTSWVLMDFFKKLPFFLITSHTHLVLKARKEQDSKLNKIKIAFQEKSKFYSM